MQQVRMNVDISGTWNGEAWPKRGELVEVDEVTAGKLLANGQASPVRHKKGDDDKVEAAVKSEDDVETATVRSTPGKRTAKD